MRESCVLVVEDDAIIAAWLVGMLRDHRYRVAGPARSGDEALRLFAEAHPSVALLDVNLKGTLYGTTVGAELAQRGVGIIYLTGHVEQAVDCRDHAVDILGKPASGEMVLNAIARAFKNNYAEAI